MDDSNINQPLVVIDEEKLAFLTERHLATLTTVRPNGSPHVVPVGFSYDAASGLVRIITSDGTTKVRNIEAGSRAVVCQVDRGRWLSLEGFARISRNTDAISEAERRYEARYQAPRPNSRRVAIEIVVDRVLGRA